MAAPSCNCRFRQWHLRLPARCRLLSFCCACRESHEVVAGGTCSPQESSCPPADQTFFFSSTPKSEASRKPQLTMPSQAPTPRTTRNSRGLRGTPAVSSTDPFLDNSSRVSRRRRTSGTPSRTSELVCFLCRSPWLFFFFFVVVAIGWLTTVRIFRPSLVPSRPSPTPPPRLPVRGSFSPPRPATKLLPSGRSPRSSTSRRPRPPSKAPTPPSAIRRSSLRRSPSPRPPPTRPLLTRPPRARPPPLLSPLLSSTRGLPPSEALQAVRGGASLPEHPPSGLPGSSPDSST